MGVILGKRLRELMSIGELLLVNTVWASEDWLQAHAKPLAESGGLGVQAPLPPGVEGTGGGQDNGTAGAEGDVDMD